MRFNLILVLLALALPGLTQANGQLDAAQEAAVLQTVEAYTTAIKNGDIQTLKALASPRFRSKRQSLYDSPGYVQFLTEYFATCQFETISVVKGQQGQAVATVKVEEADGSVVMRAITATYDGRSGRYLIANDRVVAN